MRLYSDLKYLQMFPNELRDKIIDDYENTQVQITKDKYVRFGGYARFDPTGYVVAHRNYDSVYGDPVKILTYLWYAKKYLTIKKVEYKLNDDTKRIKLTDKRGRVYACYM